MSRLQAAHTNAHVLAIGPAGERLSPVATVINDKGRASGVRHGVGSVFGSKRLKGVVVQRTGAPTMKPADAAAYRDLLARLQQQLRSSPLLSSKTGLARRARDAHRRGGIGPARSAADTQLSPNPLERHEEIGGRRMSATVLRPSHVLALSRPVPPRGGSGRASIGI